MDLFLSSWKSFASVISSETDDAFWMEALLVSTETACAVHCEKCSFIAWKVLSLVKTVENEVVPGLL